MCEPRRCDSAIEAVATLEEVHDPNAGVAAIDGLLGYAYAVNGQQDSANILLLALESQPETPGNAAAAARIYIGLGDTDRALEWLERAIDLHDPIFSSESFFSPIFDGIRSDARFGSLLARVGLDGGR